MKMNRREFLKSIAATAMTGFAMTAVRVEEPEATVQEQRYAEMLFREREGVSFLLWAIEVEGQRTRYFKSLDGETWKEIHYVAPQDFVVWERHTTFLGSECSEGGRFSDYPDDGVYDDAWLSRQGLG